MYSSSAANYDRMTHKQHIMSVTDTYVGSDEKIPRMTNVLVTDPTLRIVPSNIDLPEAVEHLFIEILSNASDNALRSKKAGLDPGVIQIRADSRAVTIRNGGITIPIEMHPTEGIYAPQMIFGCLLTSSNYDKDKDRDGCGRNGYGAKLVNIFSKTFQVRVGDSERGLSYEQLWMNNMDDVYEPTIERYNGPNYVEIAYELDFGRFGYDEYPNEALCLFGRHAADTSLSTGVGVEFNGIRFDFSDIKSYSKLLFDKSVKNLIVESPQLKVCLLDTPHDSRIISCVNGKMTSDGGVHVEAVMEVISKKLLAIVNIDDKMKLTIANLRPHLSLIVICQIPNPKFSSQTKTCLKSPKPKFEISDKDFKRITRWDLIGCLQSAIDAKAIQALSKTNGKKSKHVDVITAQDANEAGHTRSRECILYVTEGKSAAGYANQLINLTPNGRDTIGFFPMKGKPLNVMNANPLQISKNEEITNLKKLLGLTEGLDYTIDKNFSTLRYGYFVILADSDDDGKHIVGLILNLFHCRFPSLLQRGYVLFMRTPILRAKHGSITEKFYRNVDYQQWKASTPNHDKWHIKYYKGLASSTNKDIAEDYLDPRNVVCMYDDYAPDYINLAFHSKLTEMRKQWIAAHTEVHFEMVDILPISSFVNTELVEFAIANVARSIPRFLDGLKNSQRKALWTSFDRWPKRCAPKESEQMKVSQFANRASDFTDYRHGEVSMCDTIVYMAQSYTGTNNVQLFQEDGQFGNRTNTEAGSSRYIFTRPSAILPYIFRKDDDPILTLLAADEVGKFIEPVTLLPIIPMQLINGALGIGTAWSTFIPNFNPIEVLREIRVVLNGGSSAELIPWYRDYTGTISLKVKSTRVKDSIGVSLDEEDPLGDDEEHILPTDKITVLIEGRYHMEPNGVIRVTEIPIGRSYVSYETWLKALLADKKISDYSIDSRTDGTSFSIRGWQGGINLKELRLIKNVGISNMVMLDNNDKPMRYTSSSSIIEDFVATRLPYYQLRKDAVLFKLQEKIDAANMKIRFIKAIVDKEIIVEGQSKANVLAQMSTMGIPNELLKGTSFIDITSDEVANRQLKVEAIVREYNRLASISPTGTWLGELDEFEVQYNKMYM